MIENRGIVVILGIKSIVFPVVREIPKCSNMRTKKFPFSFANISRIAAATRKFVKY